MSKLLNETIKELETALNAARKLKEEKKKSNQRIKVADVVPIIAKVRETEYKQSKRIEELTNHGSEGEDDDENEEDVPMSDFLDVNPVLVVGGAGAGAAAGSVHNDYQEEGAEDNDDDVEETVPEPPKKRPKRNSTKQQPAGPAAAPAPSEPAAAFNPYKEQIKDHKKNMINNRAVIGEKITKNPFSVLKNADDFFTNEGADRNVNDAPDNVLLSKKKKQAYYDHVVADENAMESKPAVALLAKHSFKIPETIFAIVEEHVVEGGSLDSVVTSLKDLAGELKKKNGYIPMVVRIFNELGKRAEILHEITRPDGLLEEIAVACEKPDVSKSLKVLQKNYEKDKTLALCVKIVDAVASNHTLVQDITAALDKPDVSKAMKALEKKYPDNPILELCLKIKNIK